MKRLAMLFVMVFVFFSYFGLTYASERSEAIGQIRKAARDAKSQCKELQKKSSQISKELTDMVKDMREKGGSCNNSYSWKIDNLSKDFYRLAPKFSKADTLFHRVLNALSWPITDAAFERGIRNYERATEYASPLFTNYNKSIEKFQETIGVYKYCIRNQPATPATPIPPHGWRFPTESNQHVYADFNGDNLNDDAWVLIRGNGNDREQRMFVFFKQPNNSYRVINAGSYCDSIEKIKPGRYIGSYEGELRLKNHAIGVICLEEDSFNILYWDNSQNKFKSFAISKGLYNLRKALEILKPQLDRIKESE